MTGEERTQPASIAGEQPAVQVREARRDAYRHDIHALVAWGIFLVVAYLLLWGLEELTLYFSRHRWVWPTVIAASLTITYSLALLAFIAREVWRSFRHRDPSHNNGGSDA